MKKILSLVDEPLVINNMTLDRNHPMDVWNEEVLDTDEVKHLLDMGKIRVVADITDETDKP